MGPLVSESFINDAANMSGHFPASGTVEDGSAQAGALTIAYDAATQSYTLSTAGRSATFTPADLVDSGSDDYIAFQKDGATTEALTLTRPGTEGPLTFQYVGGGAWERVTQDGDALDFTFDPFTYGVVTPDNALVRSGSGLYAVSLVGARAMDGPYAMAGSGGLQVDFASGSLSSSGVLSSIDLDSGLLVGVGAYHGAAQLSSTANHFAGDFAMDDGRRFTGEWEGRFYGPNAQEVGAVWHLTADNGEVASGYLIGREDPDGTFVNNSVDPLLFSETFTHRFSQLGFEDLGDGTTGPDATLFRSSADLAFDASDRSFTYRDTAAGIETYVGADDIVAAETTSALTVYQVTGSDGITYRLTLNKPGASNPVIALSYASFGHWQQVQSPDADRIDRWFAWGVRTNGLQIPTGTGTFEGIILGTATRFGAGPIYDLGGTASFAMDFGASSFTGSLHPVGTSMADGSTRDFGSFNFDRGAIDADAGLTADIVNGTNGYLGFFEGALYGPNATEVGGSFGMQTETTNGIGVPSADASYLSGVIVGRRTGD